MKEYDQALEKYQLCHEIFRKSLTSKHPLIARALKNIGIVYESKRKHHKALKYYRQAGAIREKIIVTTHPDQIEITHDLLRVLSKMQ